MKTGKYVGQSIIPANGVGFRFAPARAGEFVVGPFN